MARRFKPGWQIYEEQMDPLCYGHALWEPMTGDVPSVPIRIGDVGYIHLGQFFLLFHAGSERGANVPQSFEPLTIGETTFRIPRGPDRFHTDSVKEIKATVGATISATPQSEPCTRFSYKLVGSDGAALVTKSRTYIQDARAKGRFEDYAIKHRDSWLEYASSEGVPRGVHPVLVTGFDVTGDFTLMAYSNRDESCETDLTIDVPISPASASLQIQITGGTLFHQSWSEPRSESAADSSDQRVPPDGFRSYVFIRYYTGRSRGWSLSFPWWPFFSKKKDTPQQGPSSGGGRGGTVPEPTAQPDAEPTTSGNVDPGGQSDLTAGGVGSESATSVRNTAYGGEYNSWDVIGYYILQNSDATFALMHYDDLAAIRMPGETDNISTLLEKRPPRIEVDANGVGRISRGETQQPGIPAPSPRITTSFEPQAGSDTITGPESDPAATAALNSSIEVGQHAQSPDDTESSASSPIATTPTNKLSPPAPTPSSLSDEDRGPAETATDQGIQQSGVPATPPSITILALQQLYHLDRSSSRFHDELNYVLCGEEYRKCVPNLQGDDLVWLVDYLDKALDILDLSSSTSRKCLRELRSVCGTTAILPTSYTLSPDLLDVEPDSFANSGFGCKGIFNGSKVFIQRARGDTEGRQKDVCQEAVVWKHLKHPNIIPLLGITTTPLQLISDWMPGGNLREYIEENPNADEIGLLFDIAKGLCYLHSCNVIHGDLKGPNILVDGSGHARIGDFSLAELTQDPDSQRSASPLYGFTPRWAAPEVLRREEKSKKGDIFSFAMVVIEVNTGMIPFPDDQDSTVIWYIAQGMRPPCPTLETFTEDLWALTNRCWDQDPDLRPEASEALQVLLTLSVYDRWINHSFDESEHVSLIGELLSSEDPVTRIEDFYGDDIQFLVDLVHEVLGDDGLPLEIRGKGLRNLSAICSRRALLPRSLGIPLRYDPKESPLHHGQHGTVWKGQLDGREVAAKVIEIFFPGDLERVANGFCTAVIGWNSLQHPNILPLLGATITRNQLMMVSEWVGNGNIKEFVRTHPNVDPLELLRDATNGLIYMHDRGMVHGNINLANILIDDHSHARLTCLNRLTIVSEDSAIRSVRHPTKALDCFALGMVIGEVLRGQELPPQYTSPSAVGVVDAERPQGAEWARFTEKIWRTLELCWGFHPDDQISAKGILLGLE